MNKFESTTRLWCTECRDLPHISDTWDGVGSVLLQCGHVRSLSLTNKNNDTTNVIMCVVCLKHYDRNELTEYTQQRWKNKCGNCDFASIDAAQATGTYAAIHGDGDGIIDYISCVDED